MSIKSDFVDRSGQTREQHNINFYSLRDTFTYFFFFATFSSQMIFFSQLKSDMFMFFRLNCRSKRDVGAAACLILIVVCSPGGGKSRWIMLVSAASGRASEHVSEVEIDAFQRAGNACVCSPNTNVNEWKQINSDKWDN